MIMQKNMLCSLLLFLPLTLIVTEESQANDAEIRVTIKDNEYGKHRLDFKIEGDQTVFLDTREKKEKKKKKKNEQKQSIIINKKNTLAEDQILSAKWKSDIEQIIKKHHDTLWRLSKEVSGLSSKELDSVTGYKLPFLDFTAEDQLLKVVALSHQGNSRYLMVMARERIRQEEEPIKEYYNINFNVDCDQTGSTCQFVTPDTDNPIKIKMKNELMGHQEVKRLIQKSES